MILFVSARALDVICIRTRSRDLLFACFIENRADGDTRSYSKAGQVMTDRTDEDSHRRGIMDTTSHVQADQDQNQDSGPECIAHRPEPRSSLGHILRAPTEHMADHKKQRT